VNELIVIEDKVTEEASFCYSKELCSSVTMSFDYSVYKRFVFICYYVFYLPCLQPSCLMSKQRNIYLYNSATKKCKV